MTLFSIYFVYIGRFNIGSIDYYALSLCADMHRHAILMLLFYAIVFDVKMLSPFVAFGQVCHHLLVTCSIAAEFNFSCVRGDLRIGADTTFYSSKLEHFFIVVV